MDRRNNQFSSNRGEVEISSNEFGLTRLNRMVLHIAFTVPTKNILSNPLVLNLYYLFTPCVFLLYSLVLTAQTLGVYQYWGDLDVTMENLFLTTGFIMCYWEGAYLKTRWVQIWQIFDRLDAMPVPATSDQALSRVHKWIVNEAHSNCKKLSWFIFLSVNVGTLMWAIFPLVNLLMHTLSEDDTPQETANKPYPYLMYIIWVPYDVTLAPNYAVTYLVQVIVYFTASLYTTSSNIVFINLVLHATSKFKVVESSILRMGEIMSEKEDRIVGESEETAGTPPGCASWRENTSGEDIVTDGYMHSRISASAPGEELGPCLDSEFSCHLSEVEVFLVECIKQHQDAIDFTRELNYIVSPWIAFSLLIYQLLLVAEVFQLALTAESGFAIMKHFMSILAILSQSLLLCWLGERHIQQSLRINAVAYDCSWYGQSTRFKRLLLMVIKRSQEPVKFCAGSFYDINIEKFDHILRRAYSFYAVLRKLKEPSAAG